MYRATINDDSLKNGLAVSAILHIMLFLFIFFGLPHLVPPLPQHHEPVPFQIVTIADMTNTRIKEEPEPQKPAPPPQPEAKPPAPTPPPPPQQTQPQPPQPPAPPKPVETPPEPQAEALKPKPVEKPKPIEKPQPPQPDLLASVLKNVAKLKPADQPKQPDQKSEVKTPAPPQSSAAPSLSQRLTMSEEDALRRQIGQCWNPPVGARDAQTLVVELIINVNPDRTVLGSPEIVDKGRYNSDSFFRAAADSAVRALLNPHCSPLELPADKYDQWKRIDFTFDPRDML